MTIRCYAGKSPAKLSDGGERSSNLQTKVQCNLEKELIKKRNRKLNLEMQTLKDQFKLKQNESMELRATLVEEKLVSKNLAHEIKNS